MRVVPDAKGETIVAFAKQSVEPGSLVLSDGLSSYEARLPPSCCCRGQSGPHPYAFGNFKTWILATHHGVTQSTCRLP